MKPKKEKKKDDKKKEKKNSDDTKGKHKHAKEVTVKKDTDKVSGSKVPVAQDTEVKVLTNEPKASEKLLVVNTTVLEKGRDPESKKSGTYIEITKNANGT